MFDDSEIEARKSFELTDSFTENQLITQFKLKAMKSPESLPILSKHVLILLKKRCTNFQTTDLSTDHENLYQNLIHYSVFEEQQNKVKLQLRDFNSLTHQKLYNAIQKIFKLKGSRVMKTNFELIINSVKFPYSRGRHEFSSVKIAGESKSINTLEITITGTASMIIVLFFLKSILKVFLKSIEDVQPNRMNDELGDSSQDDEKFSKQITSRELNDQRDSEVSVIQFGREDVSITASATGGGEDNLYGSAKMEAENNEKTIDRKSQINKKMKVSIDATNESKKICIENVQKVSIEDVTDNDDDEETYKPDIVYQHDSKTSESPEVAQDCYLCALINIAENSNALLKKENIKFQTKCSFQCIYGTEDCLEMLVNSFSRLVISSEIDEQRILFVKSNVESLLINVLDKTHYSRPDFYCKLLENLENVSKNKQQRIVCLTRELSKMLIGNNIKLFEETMKRSKLARRNILKFMQSTGNFFALQTLLESWYIMQREGVDVKSLIPSFLGHIIEMFSSGPETDSSHFFYFMSGVTRELIEKILDGKNLVCMKAAKIEFKYDLQTIEKPWELPYIYINLVDRVIYHFLKDGEDITCEEIEFKELRYEEDAHSFFTENWNFFLTNADTGDMKTLLSLSETDHFNQQKRLLKENEENRKKEQKGAMEEERNVGEDRNDIIDDSNAEQNFTEESKYFNDSDSDESETSDGGVGPDHKIETSLDIPKENISKYWDAGGRGFIRNLCGEDWPKAYGNPCAVLFRYCHTKKFKSAKRMNHFSKLVGYCKICNSKHECIIPESPFEENLMLNGRVNYKPLHDCHIEVTVHGKFELNELDEPDIGKPKHDLRKATGLCLKGKKREVIGEKVSKKSVQSVFMEQFDDIDEPQMERGNRTCVKSYDVLKMAQQEHEKKLRCGDDFFQSVVNIVDSQGIDISLNFEDTAANRELAGFVRSVQRTPFKILMANYDQLRIGANYLNKSDIPIVFVDSSGKFLKKEKGKPKLLNTAVAIPPPAKGHSPFPIFEMVSEKNKTIDFQTFLEYGWSYLSTSINNEKVRYPRVAVSDFSFANIHSCCAVFNKMKIEEYLETAYRCSLKNEKFPFQTILTICENHTLPNLLHFARNIHSDKVVADTVVAGILKVFEAESTAVAIEVFKNLAIIHCSTEISLEARSNIKEASFGAVEVSSCDFDDEAPEEDDVLYGNRKGLRVNSSHFKLFKNILDNILGNNKETKVSNRFFAPKLLLAMVKQYLSLFPLFSASMLPDKRLKTNSYIELYWKDQRRILQNVPNRLRWPPRYLGELHAKIRRDAKSIITHGLVPNLKHGGKVKPGQRKLFEIYTDENQDTKDNKNKFIPSLKIKKKRKPDSNESFGRSSEMWDSQHIKNTSRRKDNYIRGKQIDHAVIIQSMELPFENLRVTGTSKLLSDPSKKSSLPESILLTSTEITWLMKKHSYISSDFVDAGLMLLDKRLNEESNMKDSVFVYTVQNLRLILDGETDLVRKGKFITIIPRDFGLAAEQNRFEDYQDKKEEQCSPGSHYTLVSNLQCKDGEVDLYETFEPYRTKDSLLTADGKKILKILASSEELQINCINVQLQEESECGAISLGLAVQVCFYPAEEGAVQYKLMDVRKELLNCLKQNNLNYFKCAKIKTGQIARSLFSADC